jgi:hypothetical protein
MKKLKNSLSKRSQISKNNLVTYSLGNLSRRISKVRCKSYGEKSSKKRLIMIENKKKLIQNYLHDI